MKKLLLTILFVSLYATVNAAPAVRYDVSVSPKAASTYSLGDSLYTWLYGYFDGICLGGVCRTSWPTGSGGGGGDGAFSTTTAWGSILNIFANNVTDLFSIGYSGSGVATSSNAEFVVDPTAKLGLFLNSTKVGIGTTSPYAPLSVVGQIVGGYFTATTSTASTFPLANITKLSNLTSNGFVKTSGGDGTLSVDTTTYESGLTAGDGLTRTVNDFDCDTASGSTFGCVTSADYTTFSNKQPAGNYVTALTGDVTASGPGSAAATLATVNSDVGTYTNANITVNAKGLITAASNGTAGGGGGGDSVFSRNTTTNLIYNPTTTDSVAFGVTATSSVPTLLVDNSNKKVGIGTSSPYAMLSVAGQVVGQYFTATSTTDVSMFAGPVGVNETGNQFTSGNLFEVNNGVYSFTFATTSIDTGPMTSDSTPSPLVASASSLFSGSFPAWAAFDDTPTEWIGNIGAGFPAWVSIDMGTATTVNSYDLRGRNDIYDPIAWQFQGSNNGTSWATLDTRSGQPSPSSATTTYNFVNENRYRYYRIYITSSAQGSTSGVRELKLNYLPTATSSVKVIAALASTTRGSVVIQSVGSGINSNTLRLVDSTNKTNALFDSNGRLDLMNYDTSGGVMVLRNNTQYPTNNQVSGHYAFGSLTEYNKPNTTGYILNQMTNVSAASLSSNLAFCYMDSVNDGSGSGSYVYSQPNKCVTLDVSGLKHTDGRLTVYNSSGSGSSFIVRAANSTMSSYIDIYNADGSARTAVGTESSTGSSFSGLGKASIIGSIVNQPLQLIQNSIPRMTFSSTTPGNVGIGTTSPGQKLSVAGDILGNNIIGKYFTATSTTASVFPYASTTALTVSGGLYNTSLSDGCLNVTSGLIGSTGSACGAGGGGVTGGTAGMLASWINSTTLTATGTPTAASYVATSSTATSTFAGGLNVQGQVGIATSSPVSGPTMVFNAGSSILCPQVLLATSTSMTVSMTDGCHVVIRMGTSAATITLSGGYPGSLQTQTICNPRSTGGAVTYTNVLYSTDGTAVSNSTTANACTRNLIEKTMATSTDIYRVISQTVVK